MKMDDDDDLGGEKGRNARVPLQLITMYSMSLQEIN